MNTSEITLASNCYEKNYKLRETEIYEDYEDYEEMHH